MSESEIEKLCRTAAEQARGRALVIGGTGKWWTGKSIDFIRRLEDSGVDGVNLHLFTTKPEEVYAAFAEVAGRTPAAPAGLRRKLSGRPGGPPVHHPRGVRTEEP